MSTGTICKILPFFASDVIVTPGYKVQKVVTGALVDEVALTTSGIAAIPNIANGYCALVTVTLAADGSFEGEITSDNGGGVTYPPDHVSIPASS